MDSTSGHGIRHGHHERHGHRWGYGFGRWGAPQDSLQTRATTATKLSTVMAAGAPEAAPAVDEASGAEMATASLRYERQEKTSLVIRTQEGDLVRLRFAEREALAFDDTSVGTAEGEARETTVNLQTSTKVAVRISGDLNEDELAAIRSVIEQASTLAAEFFDGDAEQAFAMASELAIDGQQLAKVALRMRVREALTYDGTQTRVDVPALAPPAPAATAVVNAHDAPATDAAAADTETVDTTGDDVPAAAAGATAAETDAAAGTAAGTAAADGGASGTAADVDTPQADEAPQPEEGSAAQTAAPPTAATDPFVALRSMIEFLTHLIETFETDSETAAAAQDETDVPAASGDASAATSGATSLSFSLKLRLFVSYVTTVAAVESTGSEPDRAEGGEQAAPAADSAAVTTLTDAVETIAADAEPGYEAVA